MVKRCRPGKHVLASDDDYYVWYGSRGLVRRCRGCALEAQAARRKSKLTKRRPGRVCARGHLLTPDNVYRYRGKMICKTCHNRRYRAYLARKNAPVHFPVEPLLPFLTRVPAPVLAERLADRYGTKLATEQRQIVRMTSGQAKTITLATADRFSVALDLHLDLIWPPTG